MIEIRKHGKCVTERYLTGCKKCGCEFFFTYGDYKGTNGKAVSISCPECGNMWVGKRMGDIAWVSTELNEVETK